MTDMRRYRVLFLCTGNSCRSQMAEAIVNARFGGRWQAVSAGTRPAGYVHPLTRAALEEIGIRHEGISKPVEQFAGQDFDLVVTVCDEASETCPVWPEAGRRVHSGFPDPAKASGSPEEALEAFRRVRDAIAEHIPAVLRQWEQATDR